MLAYIMPNTFSSEPPFDRHDWIVRRPDQNGKEVRYVIDYYSVPDDPDKMTPNLYSMSDRRWIRWRVSA